jgi:[NiFe] hydrogenase diaphorase moiety small subunit
MTPSDAPCRFSLDGREIGFAPGETVLQAATRAGYAIPHLCWHPEFTPQGSCRLCSVRVDGRPAAACTTRAAPGLVVDSNTDELNAHRKTLLQMLFVEGNHFCPSCEKSGDCLLQTTAREMGMEGPHFGPFYPDRPLDASHPDILLDFNRCILCGLCVQASREIDGKGVFALGGRGVTSHLVINSPSGRLGDSGMALGDRAARICPVGAILAKRQGFSVPTGQRHVDLAPLPQAPRKLRVATVSLAGCFGCHTSLLDIDERLFDLLERVEFDRSPLTDTKALGPCDIGLIEGGLCNAENVQVLREFRARCTTLVAVGACAINGGLPAQRNHLDLGGLLTDVYRRRPGLSAGSEIPNDPELPLLMNQVRPIHEVVHVDHFLPGCPPSAEAIWTFLTDLIAGRAPRLGPGLIHYD